ncbi:hypothetical protein D3C77_68420 [compost metagenome]
MRKLVSADSLKVKSHVAPYFGIAILFLFVFAILRHLPPQRVGDGSEYYAMFYAWLDTMRPWMTSSSFEAYQQLFQSQTILGFMPADWLASAFPALKLGNTADFNHFWFYSFLAFIPARLASLVGVSIQAHTAFLALHFVLLSGTAMVAYRLYGRVGAMAFALMTFCSPMLWFFDKVHTELFTYCFTLLGVMYVFSKRYLAAALCLAVAATQNPSFALVAFVPFAYRFTLLRRQPFSLVEVCLVVATAFAVLVHPVYYFLRFGVVTPQLLAGGASLGGNLSTFYIWIFDPDLGLLPNWPLGAYFTLLAIAFIKVSGPKDALRSNVAYLVFALIFLLVNFYAHSSTTNLNSGATPGLARYSLWYLPLWFPIVLHVLRKLAIRSVRSWVLGGSAVIVGLLSIINNNPKKHEHYSSPTWLSNAIQTKLPSVYTPPAEVFAERFSGYGEGINQYRPLAVLGPDCRKLLLYPGSDREMVTIPVQCQVDPLKLQMLVKSKSTNVATEHFLTLSDLEYKSVIRSLLPGTYNIGPAGSGNFVLSSGWYDLESWGVWSKGHKASLALPCNEQQFFAGRSTVGVVLSLRSYGVQKINIDQKGALLFEGVIDSPREVTVEADVTRCSRGWLRLNVNIAEPVSPAERGESGDQRKIGVGLSEITILQ